MKKRIKQSVARDLFKWFIALAIEHEWMTMHIFLPLPRSSKPKNTNNFRYIIIKL